MHKQTQDIIGIFYAQVLHTGVRGRGDHAPTPRTDRFNFFVDDDSGLSATGSVRSD
jgi:hypothetical protein